MLNFMNIRLPTAQLVTGRHAVQIRRLRLPVPLTMCRRSDMLLFRLSCQLGDWFSGYTGYSGDKVVRCS